jgi:hypothetical protein
VREFLAGRTADRPPFLPFATAFFARLEQVSREELAADPQALVRTLVAAQRLFGLDAVVVPAEAPAAAEAIARLRIVLGGGAAIVALLPEPRLELATALGLEHVDVVSVCAQPGDEDLDPLWNVARYYSAATLLVTADGRVSAPAGDRVGVLAEPGLEPPALPDGGFYTTRELPSGTDVEAFHALVAAVQG